MIHLVTHNREETLSNRIFLLALVRMNHRSRKYGRSGTVEYRKQCEPVCNRITLIKREGVHVKRVPRQRVWGPTRVTGRIINVVKLWRLDLPFERKYVLRLDSRRTGSVE
ncbi:hypothetical protein Y027_5857 [Burkholderia pseudomallei TSV5]|nr:hypothetical protein Y025_5755 [Burkholderia pseudomallei TSV32]KGX49015.1 hypothetical protein Y027_5857 [Burkholderia pseudomallei TSV5]